MSEAKLMGRPTRAEYRQRMLVNAVAAGRPQRDRARNAERQGAYRADAVAWAEITRVLACRDHQTSASATRRITWGLWRNSGLELINR